MNNPQDFFVSSQAPAAAASTASTAAGAHPLQVLILRQCAAAQQASPARTTLWNTACPNDSCSSEMPMPSPAEDTGLTSHSLLEGASSSFQHLLSSTITPSPLTIPHVRLPSLPDQTYTPTPGNEMTCGTASSDPLASVSRKIMDLMCDVVPELPARLPMLDGQAGDTALQHRITELIRQQLQPSDVFNATSSPRNVPPSVYDTPSPTPSQATEATFGSLLPPKPALFLEGLESRSARHPSSVTAHFASRRMDCCSTLSNEALDLVSSLTLLPNVSYGAVRSEDPYAWAGVSTPSGGGTPENRRSPSVLDFPSFTDSGLVDLKDDRSVARSDQPRPRNSSNSPWWSGSMLPRSDSRALSEQRGKGSVTSTLHKSVASPCTSTTADMSDEGLSNIMAEFVLQEFLKSQTGGTVSMCTSDQDFSPKSTQSVSFTCPASQGSPGFQDYAAASPTNSTISSGRFEGYGNSLSDPAISTPNRSYNQSRQVAAPPPLLTHDVRLGVFGRNVDRESLLISPANQSPSLNLTQRCRTNPDRSSQRRSTLVGGEPLVPRSPVNRARQLPRRSVELTHSQAMLAMAAVARKSNCAYTDDHDRMVYISWIPKQSRAYTTMDRRRMELELKKKLREEMQLEGVTKVLLFPPKGAHCKLIFDKRASAEKFMTKYGGDDGSEPSELWKHDICNAFGIMVNERFAKTVVKIEWSQK